VSKSNDGGRRGFLRTLARAATGGVLAGGVGWLSARSGRACLREFRCRGCPELTECGEPQAILMREHERRQTETERAHRRTKRREDGKSSDG